jgi:hypothetical protein
MGKNNRQRRAAKKRARNRSGRVHSAGTTSGFGASIGAGGGVDEVVDLALTALWSAVFTPGPVGAAGAGVDAIGGLHARLDAAERHAVAEAISEWMVDEIGALAERGWQPVDLKEIVGRKLSAEHAALVVTATVAYTATDEVAGLEGPQWSQQLRDLGVEHPGAADAGRVPTWVAAFAESFATAESAAWALAIETLRLLVRLPAITELESPPGSFVAGRAHPDHGSIGSDSRVDRKVLDKVRALLAKAESTTFPEEADTLTAKAQELMARYSIDCALLSARDQGDAGEPSVRRVWIDSPYAEEKSGLLHAIAIANRCRAVYTVGFGFTTVFGYPADLDVVEILFASLLVQASTQIAAAGTQRDHRGRSRTRSFRASFWTAFGLRIGERLAEASREAVDHAAAEYGGTLLPVLVSREDRVEATAQAAFPNVQLRSARVSNHAGWVAGRIAADQAHLALGPEVDAAEPSASGD